MNLTPGKWKISILTELFTPSGYGSDDSDNYFDLVSLSSVAPSNESGLQSIENQLANISAKIY
jgi:hypothetical protein